jgi:hypothetical protein
VADRLTWPKYRGTPFDEHMDAKVQRYRLQVRIIGTSTATGTKHSTYQRAYRSTFNKFPERSTGTGTQYSTF